VDLVCAPRTVGEASKKEKEKRIEKQKGGKVIGTTRKGGSRNFPGLGNRCRNEKSRKIEKKTNPKKTTKRKEEERKRQGPSFRSWAARTWNSKAQGVAGILGGPEDGGWRKARK